LMDSKLTRAKVVIYDIDEELGKSIEAASLFAKLDPYRAATNNKGALNGMDAVAIATGNDWRALEAGVHAYAALDEHYHSITQWKMQHRNLVGFLEAPINVGTIGGVTKIHPTAALCLRMLNINKADELARIIAAVGLVQNLGALRALTREGINWGHMKLHINNLCIAAGAKPAEMLRLKRVLDRELNLKKHITLSDAKEALAAMRHRKRRH
jgi:hydroxymethylglutaryl-CoA reductase